MKLSALIAAVGDEHIGVQSLSTDAVSYDYGRKKGATITFATDSARVQEMLTGQPKYVGMVIWIPKDKIPDEVK